MLGLPPQDCAAAEDAHSGIEAAKRDGFYAVAIGDAAKANTADLNLRTLRDIF
ncbi:MAG: hypothetical protein ACI4K9_06075 [Candidatus Fimenecus sp.]